MEENQNSDDHSFFFEEIVKKTKTGITFPKSLRDLLFEEEAEIFFRLVVPNEKDKIILEFLTEEQVKELSEKLKARKPKMVIYRAALKAYNLKKDEVIYIDDRKDLVEKARERGFISIQFKEINQFKKRLKQLGINVDGKRI